MGASSTSFVCEIGWGLEALIYFWWWWWWWLLLLSTNNNNNSSNNNNNKYDRNHMKDAYLIYV